MDMQSKAKKLIEMIQTAPVEWKPLGEVAEIGTGSSNRQDEEHDGEYPFYVRSKNILRSSTYQFNETAIIIPGEGGIGDIFHYAEGKYALHQRAYRVHVVIPDLSPKFLYYFMNVDFKRYIQAKSVGATATSIRKPMLQRFPIPIPPLEIQQKIVKILDKFTELEATLEATLEAELVLRKRQYQYYRDFLLDFDNQIGGGIADGYKGRLKDVVWKTLGEIAEYSKDRICSDKLNKHNYVGVDNLLQNREGKKLSGYVPSEGKMTEYIVNDILIGNIRPYLKKIWQADCTGGTNGDVLVIRVTDEKVNPKYLYQVLADDKFFAFNMKHAKGAKMPRGSKAAIMQYKIPIPPLPKQEKIVAILDKFDTLTHSISEGLPHEIALCRKQYEYYREQLLAFPKAA